MLCGPTMASCRRRRSARGNALSNLVPTARPPPRPGRGRRAYAAIMRGGSLGLVLQLIVLLGVVVLVVGVAHNLATNLTRLGIKTGFWFLSRPAGFDISQTLIPYSDDSTYFTVFVVALLNTLLVSMLSITLGTLLGFVVALSRSSSNELVAVTGSLYVETFRNIPLLIQLLFWYFAVVQALPAPGASFHVGSLIFLSNRGLFIPSIQFGDSLGLMFGTFAAGLALSVFVLAKARRRLIATGSVTAFAWWALLPPIVLPLTVGVYYRVDIAWNIPQLHGFNFDGGIAILPELLALTVGLSMYSAAFIAEIIRGGIQAVSRGQTDAAKSLGLTRWQTSRLIVIPLALRVIVPPLGAYYVVVLKNSSLGTAIAYPDLILVFAGTVLNQTAQPIEVMTITLMTYLALGYVFSFATSAVNRQVRQ
jgi:general L-amino acid transport system permease protein